MSVKGARFCFLALPEAPLRQTLQDVVAQAELVVSLAAIDALQRHRHQLVGVPDHFLRILDEREGGKKKKCK